MKEFEIVISVAATAVPLIGTIAAFMVKIIKSVRFGRDERTQRLWAEFAQEAIKHVEVLKGKSNGELTGETKKEIAMNKIEASCIKNGILFDREKVNAIIEEIIELTKTVNSRKDSALIPATQHINQSL